MINSIKTTVDVEINDGMIGTKSVKVVGIIDKVEMGRNFNQYNIMYRYEIENGEAIKNGIYTLREEEINTLCNSIKELLPEEYDEMSEIESQNIKYYTAFRVLMAKTFTLEYEEVEFLEDN